MAVMVLRSSGGIAVGSVVARCVTAASFVDHMLIAQRAQYADQLLAQNGDRCGLAWLGRPTYLFECRLKPGNGKATERLPAARYRLDNSYRS